MKNLLLLIIVFLAISCNKEKPNNWEPKVPPNIYYFSFINNDGVDLLNPQNANAFDFSTFRLFYLKNGIKEEVINGGGGPCPRNMCLSCSNDFPVCLLGIVLSDMNILETGAISDTICVEDNGHIIRYNGEVVWNAWVDGYRIPIATIIK